MVKDMAKSIEYLNPAQLAAPRGHYSPATTIDGLIFVSGQLPDIPEGGASFPAQVKARWKRSGWCWSMPGAAFTMS